MKYALTNYILTLKFKRALAEAIGIETLSIGGEGSYLDNFSFSLNGTLWSTKADATGSWVHKKSLDRSGKCGISMNMLSPQITTLTRLFNLYFSPESSDESLTITLSDAASNVVVTCEDCLLTSLPDLTISETPGNRNWEFTCGKIVIA